MRKLNILFFVLFTSLGFAQCEISGSSTIYTGESAIYNISHELAQCRQCHYWTSTGNVSIMGDNRQNSVSVKALSQGNATLTLQYFSPTGLVKCSKDINVAISTVPPKNMDSDCDIDLANYKEVKTGNNTIAFFPETNQDLNYTWNVFYQNGTTLSSSEKVPQFIYAQENPIVKVEVKVLSKICYKKFTKTYDAYFWSVFK